VLGVYAPAISTFPNSTEGIGTPSVHTGPVEDVYLTLVSSPTNGGRITLGVRINPMILWLWIGGGVMALGTILALSPRLRRRSRAPVPAGSEAETEDPALEEVPV
jgi:cytochrome c-type biogenesis protein CcmF